MDCIISTEIEYKLYNCQSCREFYTYSCKNCLKLIPENLLTNFTHPIHKYCYDCISNSVIFGSRIYCSDCKFDYKNNIKKYYICILCKKKSECSVRLSQCEDHCICSQCIFLMNDYSKNILESKFIDCMKCKQFLKDIKLKDNKNFCRRCRRDNIYEKMYIPTCDLSHFFCRKCFLMKTTEETHISCKSCLIFFSKQDNQDCCI